MAGLLEGHFAQSQTDEQADECWSRFDERERPNFAKVADPQNLKKHLVSTIEGEIIPRLMMVHKTQSDETASVGEGPSAVAREDIEEFAKMVVAQDDHVVNAYIEAVRARGVSVEGVFLNLLGPTAQYLGDLWTEDRCSFAEVTMGLGRLQQALRWLSRDFVYGADNTGPGRRALLIPTPGEQHTFGIYIVAEFLRRASWDVATTSPRSNDEIVSTVRKEWFAVVGLSLASELGLSKLEKVIERIRKSSRNESVAVMVGGPVFSEHPEYCEQIGADATARDAEQTVSEAENLLAESPARRL